MGAQVLPGNGHRRQNDRKPALGGCLSVNPPLGLSYPGRQGLPSAAASATQGRRAPPPHRLEFAMTLIFKLPPAFSAALLMTAALIGPVGAQTATDAGDKVVARVDGAPITEKDLALAAEDLSDRLGGASEAQKREDLISYVIDLRLGTKAANDAKIAESPDFARKFAYLRDKILL